MAQADLAQGAAISLFLFPVLAGIAVPTLVITGEEDDLIPVSESQAIAAAVKGKIKIFVDGGIRSGADVLKMLALGAEAVLVGRPVLWALAVGGRGGVRFTRVADRALFR